MKVIISGGGTGGHIFPAVAIANAIKKKYSDCDILFIGAKNRMEMEKVPQAGYKIEGLWISGLQRRLTLKNVSFPLKVVSSIIKAFMLIQRFKPDIVIGVGGYASGPTLRAATTLGYPTLIQEQNSYPGITNKLLAKKVDKICVAYDNMNRWFDEKKICFTGNPVRQNIVDIENKREAAAIHFELEQTKRTVLVVGGSLGARTINESIAKGLRFFVENDIQLIWQTGKNYFDKAKQEASGFNSNNIKVYDFIYEMDLAYSMADVIVSRAGAIAISELCVIGKPTILVPSPNVSEDHQTKNAMALVNKNAGILVRDVESREMLIEQLDMLLKDQDVQNILSDNIKKLGIRDADQRILDVIEELLKKK